MEANNSAKLREALRAALDLIFDMQNADRSPLSHQAYAVRRKIKAALAAPLRQCDVGTAEEQSERFDKVCSYRFTGNCAGCQNPLDDSAANGVGDCALFWAQMPYEEGGAK